MKIVLQRLDAMRVKEERHNAHESDAITVCPRFFIRDACYDNLPEVVADMPERKGFLFPLLVVGDIPCRLNVETHIPLVDDEINFVALAATSAVYGREHLHDADINGVVSTDKFVVDDVFHEVCVFTLPEVEPRIANASINRIVLGGTVEVSIAAQIEETGIADKKCRFKMSKISADGHFVACKPSGGVYCVAELCRVGKATDVAHYRVGHGFKERIILEVEPLGNIPKIDCCVEVVKIHPFFGFGFKKCTFGQSTECAVGVADLEEISRTRHCLYKLCERKRRDFDDFTASAELGSDILRKESGIGAGHVSGNVCALEKTVEDMVESDVCVGAIFGTQTRKVSAFGKYWLRMLNFIDKDEARRGVGWKARANLLSEGDGITAEKKFVGFKINFNYMIWGDSAVKQMLFEEVEKKETLPATSHSNQNLDKIVVFCFDKLVQKNLTFNSHFEYLVLKSCAGAREFKVARVYQNMSDMAMASLIFCASAREFKLAAA